MSTLRLSLVALVIATGLLVQAPACAEHDLTCHPSEPLEPRWPKSLEIGSLKAGDDSVPREPGTPNDPTLHLRGTVRPEGTARVAGFLATDGQRLVARPGEPAHASCADTDGDGVAGLSRLVAAFSPINSTREHVLVAIAPIGGDVEQRGIYQLTVTIGGTTLRVEAEAAYGPAGQTRRA